MYTKKIPYTEKHPFMFQVYLRGYIIETTSETKHNKLVEYLKVYCNDDSYADLPKSKKIMIESEYTVRWDPGLNTEPAPESFPMIDTGEGAPQYTFDVPADTQLSLF